MTRQSTYVLHTDSGSTEYRVTGTSPAKALRALCAAAGLTLTSQNGRYGMTTDGESVAALTVPWSRVRNPDHGTTRVR